MAIGVTREVTTEIYNNCDHLRSLLNWAINNLNYLYNDFKNIQKEKKSLENKLEVNKVE